MNAALISVCAVISLALKAGVSIDEIEDVIPPRGICSRDCQDIARGNFGMKPFCTGEIDRLRSLWDGGSPITAISQISGRTKASIYYAVKHYSFAKRSRKRIPPPNLVAAISADVCKDSPHGPEDLFGKRRYGDLPILRARVYFALRNRGYSLPSIGAALGGKDQTGVLHSLRCKTYLRQLPSRLGAACYDTEPRKYSPIWLKQKRIDHTIDQSNDSRQGGGG
jgi:DNA-binding transcriptional MerR regulator